MLDFALERRYQLAILCEYGQIEIVVIVGDENFAGSIDAHADRIVGDALTADLTQKHALIAEYFDAMGTIVADEYLLFVIDNHAVRELEVLAAAELLQHIAGLIENDDAHHLAFNDNDASLVVDGDTARMLQYVGAEFAHKLTVLIVDLYLVCGRAFGDNNVARCTHNSHTIRIEQLAVTFATLAKLEFESALLVENLNAMIVGVGNDNVVLCVHRHTARLGELALGHTEFAKFAVVNHFLALDLGLWREHGSGHQFRCQIDHVIILDSVAVDIARRRQWNGVLVGNIVEYVFGAAIAPLLVRVHLQIHFADKRAETVGSVESLRDDIGIERAQRLL